MRTFIAIEISPGVHKRLAEAQDRLRAARCAVKWVKPELIHLTLRFLGDIEDDALGGLEQLLASAVEEVDPFELTVSGLGAFPERGAPRVVWAGVQDAGSLTVLHSRIEAGVRRLGFEPDDHPFAPHLTVGRVKEPRGADALRALIEAGAATQFGSSPVRDLALMLSTLSPSGPTYTPLRRRPL